MSPKVLYSSNEDNDNDNVGKESNDTEMDIIKRFYNQQGSSITAGLWRDILFVVATGGGLFLLGQLANQIKVNADNIAVLEAHISREGPSVQSLAVMVDSLQKSLDQLNNLERQDLASLRTEISHQNEVLQQFWKDTSRLNAPNR